MKPTRLALIAIAILLFAAVCAGVSAAQEHPGVAGEANCHGLTVSYDASHGTPPAVLATTQGIAVKDVQATVAAGCVPTATATP